MDDIDGYLDAMGRLHCDRPAGRPRPHKAVMLLAVTLLAEADELPENRIVFSSRLLDIFRSLFEVARQDNDQNTPYNPFFYLKSEAFWHLNATTGHEAELRAARTIQGPGQLRELVDHAALDPDLFELIKDPDSRRAIQAALIQHYCGHATGAMWDALAAESQIETRRQKLLREEAGQYGSADERVRSTAFRRMIREIYDVRCAACGVRFFFEDVDLIDAAHLVPFRESRDDRPQNGIALCKNHHWLMDHAIIAPGPGRGKNYRRPIWHVRKGLDDRLEEHRSVLDLRHRDIILPNEQRYAPSSEGQDWRMGQLDAIERRAAS